MRKIKGERVKKKSLKLLNEIAFKVNCFQLFSIIIIISTLASDAAAAASFANQFM